MQALVIGNVDDFDAGLVGESLNRRGWELRSLLREDFQAWPRRSGTPDLEGVALVVSLGSGWSTYWDHVADAVRAEQEVLRSAIDAGRAVLGVCFGGQQLATVLGGHVQRAPQAEIGWCTVEVSTDLTSPFGDGDATVPPPVAGEWMQWHYDVFTPPPEAEVLAVSPVGVQAFLYGRSLGLQFHPEATESIVRDWSSGEGSEELAAVGLTPDGLVADTAERLGEMTARCDRLVGWYLDRVGLSGN